MDKIVFALLRGVCQLPAYVAYAKGYLRDVDIDAELSIAPTAWTVPQRLIDGEVQFAVIPWTRVAADKSKGNRLTLICGSGFEEAAMVVRNGLTVEQVTEVAVPNEGGIKDLTAMALVQRLGWQDANIVRMPSGDGAILSFVGEGADAASMVEPYATMLEHLGMGHVIQRTGDVWPGAPGCTLTTTSNIISAKPDLVQRMVGAYMRGARFADTNREEAADIAEKYIGISGEIIRKALNANQPNPDAIRNQGAMDGVINLMIQRGYIDKAPSGYKDLSFLDKAEASAKQAACC
jgi:ABC-type nitrate/sulfonate/bicarbonate transport system substrate-binding protein